MIYLLDGVVYNKRGTALIIMTHGVGYGVFVPASLLHKSSPGQKLTLYIHTHVREDVLSLFGFEKENELELFELLIAVSGVGPRTALSIIERGVDAVVKAVTESDVAFFTMIPRLGKKNAQKIIIELTSKFGNLKDFTLDQIDSGETQDLVEALKEFGFSIPEIKKAIKSLPSTATTLEEKIRIAFKYLGKHTV